MKTLLTRCAIVALLWLVALPAVGLAVDWYFDDTGVAGWGQTYNPPYWEDLTTGQLGPGIYQDMHHETSVYGGTGSLTQDYSGFHFIVNLYMANNYEDHNNPVTVKLRRSPSPGNPGTELASASGAVTNYMGDSLYGQLYQFDLGVMPDLDLINEYLVVEIIYTGQPYDAHIYWDRTEAPSGLNATPGAVNDEGPWYFDDTGTPGWGQTYNPPYWEPTTPTPGPGTWHDLDHLNSFYAQTPALTHDFSGLEFHVDLWLANNYEDHNNPVTVTLRRSNAPNVPGTALATATMAVTNMMIIGEQGQMYRFNLGIINNLNLVNGYLVTEISYTGIPYDAHIYWDYVEAPSGLHAGPPTGNTYNDDFEQDLWELGHDRPTYDGTWIAAYSENRAHSPTRSIRTALIGGGASGEDSDLTFARREFELTPGTAPTHVGVWYNSAGIGSNPYSLRAACYVRVAALDADGESLGAGVFCILAFDDIGNWQEVPTWNYQEGRPAEYEPGAPDYSRQPDGSLQPPEGWWYRLDIDPSAQLDVEWSQATTLQVMLITRGSWMCGNTVDMYWDDFSADVSSGTVAVHPTPLAGGLRLDQNYPNPFNPTTEIAFWAPRESRARLDIFDVRGAHVVTLLDGVVEPGRQSAVWEGRDGAGRAVASGTYLYTVRVDGQTAGRTMTLLK